MKLLRETIRNMIMESATIIDSQAVRELGYSNLIIVVDMQAPQSEIDVYLCDTSDYDEEYGDISNYAGKINVTNIGKRTMQISSSMIDSEYRGMGIGALLYNTALAICTSERLWLMSDREEVSPDAERIYDAWKKSPSEYEIEQMDEIQPDESHSATRFEDYDPDVDYFLTKDRDDDVHHGSFHDSISNWNAYDDSDPRAQWGDMVKDWWYFFDEEYKEDFLASGLTKRFKMKDARGFINALEGLEVLYRMNQ